MKKLFTIFFSLLVSYSIIAQVAPNKYWVKFTDKDNSPFSIDNPGEFLSQRAIDRRTAYNIPIDESDLPVNQTYINAVAAEGATVLNASKWFNSVTIFTTNPAVVDAINQLPFVMGVEKSSGGNSIANSYSEKPFFAN